jgi:hypothetical protein
MATNAVRERKQPTTASRLLGRGWRSVAEAVLISLANLAEVGKFREFNIH